MSVLTEDALKLEAQINRCHAMIREYFNAQGIRIDYRALFQKLDPPPLLFQFCHEIAYLKKDWKDALRSTIEKRDQVMAYANGLIDEWGNPRHEDSAPAASSDRTDNGVSLDSKGKR